MTGTEASGRAAPAMMRWALVAVLAAGFVAFFAFGLDSYLDPEILQRYRGDLHGAVESYPFAGALLFVGVYALATAFSVPGGLFLSVTGGFLFGSILGAIYVTVGATAGATAVFLIARSAFGAPLRARAGPWLARLEAGFVRNAMSYLLFLRLMPLFPFFVVNLVPAFLGVSLRVYVAATFVGILPATFVFTAFGAGLDNLFALGEEASLHGILSPELLVGLGGLAVLAVLPVGYRAWRRRAGSGVGAA
jgi:uncharacterized membrane protein YdjX (TVP38/TMEM64 family)